MFPARTIGCFKFLSFTVIVACRVRGSSGSQRALHSALPCFRNVAVRFLGSASENIVLPFTFFSYTLLYGATFTGQKV